MTFIEPWFLDRKLQLSVDLYYRDYAFLSPNDIYDETRAGGKVGLERALGSDFLRGGVSYTLEDVGIRFDQRLPFCRLSQRSRRPVRAAPDPCREPGERSAGHRDEPGGLPPRSSAGASLAYDTRNSVRLPDKGQRTELTVQTYGGPLGAS